MLTANLPRHIAIIMDGNGRWAKQRGLPRFQGHLEGVKRVEEIVESSSRLGIKVLTLFTFSTENWKRPATEVAMLMQTFSSALENKVKRMMDGNVRLSMIGQHEGIPADVHERLQRATELTKKNSGLILNLAFNYGSRLEIIQAIRVLAQKVQDGELQPSAIDDEMLSAHLYTSALPDPDLLIRTSGEQRISNFLLWQLSYTEFYFTQTHWPDFNEEEFKKALAVYQQRERRYGQVTTSPQK